MAERFSDPRERSSTVARTLVVTPFARGFSGLRARFSDALLALGAMVAVVLLVTCANISNLLLARATGRSRETGIRISLGATTARLVRQYLVESLVLAAAGGAASVLAGYWTSAFLARAVFGRTGELPPVFTLDARVWIFTAVLSIGCALAFGLAPALRAVAAGWTSGITINQRVSTYVAMKGMRPLVAAQLALSFAVVFAAVLLGRTLSYFARIDPGFNPDRLITAAIDPDTSGYSREQIPVMVDRLVADDRRGAGRRLDVGHHLRPHDQLLVFERLHDRRRGPRHPVEQQLGRPRSISQRSAFRSWPAATSRSATRHRARAWRSSASRSRAGISRIRTRSVSGWGTTRPTPRSSASSGTRVRRCTPNRLRWSTSRPDNHRTSPRLHMRSPCGSPATRMSRFPRFVPPFSVRRPVCCSTACRPWRPPSTAMSRVSGSSPIWRSSFAVLALLLACIGLYGVLSYTVARRTQEIGVRMALGARPGDLTRMVIGDGSRVVLAGIGLGILAAMIVGRLVTTLLAGVTSVRSDHVHRGRRVARSPSRWRRRTFRRAARLASIRPRH